MVSRLIAAVQTRVGKAMDHGALRPLQPLVLEVRSVLGRMRQRPFRPAEGSTYLNLGSGRDRFPGFVGVDLFGSGADLELDLRRPLPMADASVAGIFSEHAFEHLSYATVTTLLGESYRV